MNLNQNYLQSALLQFKYYKQLGDKSFSQLQEEELIRKPSEESLSIANLVKHMWGNMRSRFIDFLDSDGEKPWRNRDSEFEDTIKSRKELLDKWEEGWSYVFNAIEKLKNTDLLKTVYIRNQGHSVIEALNRQLGHYAYHTGQIVYLAKMCKDQNWESLSIPKNKSEQFNKEKFSTRKRNENFAEEYLKNENGE